MQDLDFEELDKAVNSLMPQPSDNNSSPAQLTPVAASAPVVVATQEPTQAQPTVKSTSDLKSISRPSTGRFMDVVHPSSDMRASLNVPQRSLSPSLAPTSTSAAPVTVPQPSPDQSTESSTTQLDNWAGLPNYQQPASAPESPFLPDTKVEKRPLGAFSNDTNSQDIIEPPVVETEDAEKVEPELVKSDMPANNSETSNIPAELDSSILDIEANSSTHKNDVDINKNPLSHTPGATSINQQYKEKPGSDKSVSGSIYDANSYNKAISSPIKKKSGWMMVVWIAILLVVGVGAGLAFYHFMPDFKLPF